MNISDSLKPFDKMDYLIIKELTNDATISASKISKKISANERTIRRRIDRLVKTGAIKIRGIVEPTIFGYNSIVDINLAVNNDIYDEFIENCKKDPNVSYIATGWGESNLALQARFKSTEEMYDFINKTLPSIPGVKIVNFFIIPKILYNIDQWAPEETDFNTSTD